MHLDVHDALWANDPRALADFTPPDGPLVLVCGRGNTSMLAMTQLRARGIAAMSLHGGMRAWSLAWNVAPVPARGFEAEILQVRRTGKGCLSYLIGSRGTAAVIDPSVDPNVYVDLAAARGWKIALALDTHIHADHLSRARQLGELAGATVYLPDQRRVTFPFTAAKDGDVLTRGGVTLAVLATPGHTFESVCYLLEGKVLFTGDTIFLTGVGRPDLAAKADEETRKRARLLFASLQSIRQLPPDTLVLPGHSGTPTPFDGKALVSTLAETAGRAELLQLSEEKFVEGILARIPAPPANHLEIVRLNEQGTLPPDVAGLEEGANRCAVR